MNNETFKSLYGYACIKKASLVYLTVNLIQILSPIYEISHISKEKNSVLKGVLFILGKYSSNA